MEGFPGVTENVQDSYEAYHAKVKALLGNKYDEQRVDGCMAIQAPGKLEEIYAELQHSLEQARSEEEKGAIRESWLNKYDVISGLGEDLDEEPAEIN